MENVSKIQLFSYFFMFFALAGCCSCCGNSDEEEARIDVAGLAAADMMDQMEYMAEVAYSNQNGFIDVDSLSISDANGSLESFQAFGSDSVVYMYFTPMECWECIKSVCGHIRQEPYFEKIKFIVPLKYKSAINVIAADAEIPADRTYILSDALGLPIEDENRIFFFTLDDRNMPANRLSIKNVFVPSREFAGITDTYFDAIGCSYANLLAE